MSCDLWTAPKGSCLLCPQTPGRLWQVAQYLHLKPQQPLSPWVDTSLKGLEYSQEVINSLIDDRHSWILPDITKQIYYINRLEYSQEELKSFNDSLEYYKTVLNYSIDRLEYFNIELNCVLLWDKGSCALNRRAGCGRWYNICTQTAFIATGRYFSKLNKPPCWQSQIFHSQTNPLVDSLEYSLTELNYLLLTVFIIPKKN